MQENLKRIMEDISLVLVGRSSKTSLVDFYYIKKDGDGLTDGPPPPIEIDGPI